MKVTVIGLGAMGRPIARRLAAAGGIDVAVFDVNAQAVEAFDADARKATSLADAVGEADVILTILPADQHVLSIASEAAAHASADAIFVDFSTIGPSTIRRASDLLAASGVATVSVGMTRSTAAAEAGQLVLYVGGDDARTIDRLRPLFAEVSEAAPMVGGLESAKVLKLANNLVIAIIDIAICEALALARHLSIGDRELVDALRARSATSWVLNNHIEKYVLPDDLGPGRFSTLYMAKDMLLCQDIATAYDVPAAFPGIAAAYYRATTAMGYGQHYHMIVLEWLRRASATDDNSAPFPSRDEALDAVAAGVSAIQVLVTEEAIELAGRSGIPAAEARRYLSDGSAGNAWLEQTLRQPPDLAVALVTARRGIDAFLSVARQAQYPGILFEAARTGTFR